MNIYGFLNAAAADINTNPGQGQADYLRLGWPLKIQMLRDFKAQADRCGFTLAGVIDNRPDLQWDGLSLSGYTDARLYAGSGTSGLPVNRDALNDPIQFKAYCQIHRRLFGSNPEFYVGPETPDHLYDHAKLAADLVRFILGGPCTLYIDGYWYRRIAAATTGIEQDYLNFEATLSSFGLTIRGEYERNWHARTPPAFLNWYHFSNSRLGSVPAPSSVVLIETPSQASAIATYTQSPLHITVPMAGMPDAALHAIVSAFNFTRRP